MSDKSFSSDKRAVLHQALIEQYEGLVLDVPVQYNIDSLLNDHTYTVTTGHQLGLMGGPLFTVYKVMSAIRLAEDLSNQYPDKHVVPIFWIHTEDHDFEEINHFYEGFGDKKTYTGSFSSDTGSHVLEESIRSLIPSNFEGALKEAWQEGKTLAEAYRYFFHHLLGKYGLVILDASHPELKALFQPVLKRELFDQMAFEAVGKTSRELEGAGYKLQIHPREINLFYLDEEGRNRITWEDGEFQAVDRELSWTKQDMQAMIAHSPEKFSPNVSLRPLYQETILPNLAYFGGWGELSYWMQLKGVFDAAGENFPVVLPRFSATLFPTILQSKWEALGLYKQDIIKGMHEINRMYTPRLWDDERFIELETEILDKIEELRGYIDDNISDTLSRSAAALKVKTSNFTANLYKKANRIVRDKHVEPFKEIQAVKNIVNPDGQVQERVWSLGALKMNPQQFVEWLKPLVQPLTFEHWILELPETVKISNDENFI